MNYYNDLRGMLSETEQDLGLGFWRGILSGRDDSRHEDEDEDEDKKPASNIDYSRFKEAARIVAGLTEKSEVRSNLIQNLMREEVDWAIKRYLKIEQIPYPYHSLIRLEDCIEILLRGIFYKVVGLPRNSSLDSEIFRLCTSLRANKEKLIVYDRVSLLQNFLHEKLRRYTTIEVVENDFVKPIRCLLSVSRLHLNLVDLEMRDPAYNVYMHEVSSARASLEYLAPSLPPLAAEGKKIYKRWRVRHLRPISYFYRRVGRRRLSALLGLDIEMPFEDYVEDACSSFALLHNFSHAK